MKLRRAVRAAIAATALVGGCGGGGSIYLFIGPDGESVPGIDVSINRAGARSIELQWTDDSYADTFRVERDGATLVGSTRARSVVDSALLANTQYCYQVFGFDSIGRLVSASDEVCIGV
jgi:hypothetical protein